MTQTKKQHLTIAVSVLALVLAPALTLVSSASARAAVLTSSRVLRPRSLDVQTHASAHSLRSGVAMRLQKRIAAAYNVRPSLSSIEDAVAERQELLARTLNVTIAIDDQTAATGSTLTWGAAVAQHPTWIRFDVSGSDVSFTIDAKQVNASVSDRLPLNLPKVQDATVLESKKDTYGVYRVTTTGFAKEGYELLNPDAGTLIADALQRNKAGVEIGMRKRSGEIVLSRDGRSVVLTRLSAGVSDFRTSPWGRKANIKKGVEQHLNHVLIPQGTEFSFNDTLSGPVTLSRGWFDSLIIVNGSELEPAPGGGICQVATTVYRAALLAGLPITRRAPHSLYVHYYELFGLGLDATIFPGKQDLNFKNDTQGDVVVQATMHGTEVLVEFYGVDDKRTTDLAGPFFSVSGSEKLPRALRSNEIGWIRSVTHADGTVTEEPIISAYGKMPKSLAKNILSADEETQMMMHAAAPAEMLTW